MRLGGLGLAAMRAARNYGAAEQPRSSRPGQDRGTDIALALGDSEASGPARRLRRAVRGYLSLNRTHSGKILDLQLHRSVVLTIRVDNH
jgi:hypothetical protein